MMQYDSFSKPRFWEIDFMRGLAIVAMIIFHFVFDLTYFGLVPPKIIDSSGWLIFQKIIAGSFICISGLSFDLSHYKGVTWVQIKNRTIILGASAALVSIVTYQFFGKFWVKFGILHCILACSLLSIFVPRLSIMRFLSVLVSVIFLYLYVFPLIHIPAKVDFIVRSTYPHLSVDYQPIFPMILIFYFGMLLSRLYFRKGSSFQINNGFCALIITRNILINAGKNSLLIYLFHQPVLFGGLICFVYLLR